MNVKLITAVAVVLQTAALGAMAQQPDTTTRPDATQVTPGSESKSMDQMDHSRMVKDGAKDHGGMANMPVSTKIFVQKAATTDMAEIKLGEMALQKSKDPEVRAYAQRMVKDHTASSQKLKSAAAAQDAPLPTMLDREHQQLVQRFEALDGEAFDREYTKRMEQDHHKAIALFESASQSQQVAEPVRQFAKNSLPTLKEHRKLAEGLDSQGAKSTSDSTMGRPRTGNDPAATTESE